MVDVSCSSRAFCEALTDVSDAVTYNGHRWTLTRIYPPGGLSAVSCATSSFCVAVGHGNRDEVVFNGRSWSRPIDVDRQSGLVEVSCATVSFCVATDESGRALIRHLLVTGGVCRDGVNSRGVSASVGVNGVRERVSDGQLPCGGGSCARRSRN